MDQVVFLRVSVPEEAGGFLSVSTFDSFGLKGCAGLSVESVLDGYCG